MKRIVYILLFVFVYSLSAIAQIPLPDKVNIFLPDYLKERLIEERHLSKVSKANKYGQSNSVGEKKRAVKLLRRACVTYISAIYIC